MINHNIQSMSISAHEQGEISLPSEDNPITFAGNLRQFIILTRRSYNQQALNNLKASEGLKISSNSSHLNSVDPYFGIILKFTPIGSSIEDFISEYGDEFFDSLLSIIGTSTKRRLSGQRAVFIREFHRDTVDSETMVSSILVNTNVFYNDYRVTTGYPSTAYEVSEEKENISKRLNEQWGNILDIHLDAVFEPSVNNEDDMF